MKRIIKSMTREYKEKALDLVEKVFTDYENADEAKVVRNLVEEIRSKRFYIPELELIMVDEMEQVIGFAMFSRFHLEGNPQNYRARGFKTSADYGIFADESVGLPAVECLMVKALEENSLERIKGIVNYDDYESLK